MKPDDLYARNGITWRRTWTGDNSGRYEWTSDDGRLICFREGKVYAATLDGYASTKTWPTLTAAMAELHRSRDAWDRRRVVRDPTGEHAA